MQGWAVADEAALDGDRGVHDDGNNENHRHQNDDGNNDLNGNDDE